MLKYSRILIIDDDPVYQLLAKRIISGVLPNIEIVAFLAPAEAIEFITAERIIGEHQNTLVLLDINMPVLGGWDLLGEFEKLDAETKAHFTFYMVSSSNLKEDIERIKLHKNVAALLSKPLSRHYIEAIFA